MVRIYTRGGDRGQTSLGDGSRVDKHAVRVELYGEVDELNSVLGLAAAMLADDDAVPADSDLHAELPEVQGALLTLGALLADPSASESPTAETLAALGAGRLESFIDAHETVLPDLTSFVLPGGTPAAGALHVARSICRRLERAALSARAAEETLPAAAFVFLNRLSDYLFVAARRANALAGRSDVPWQPPAVEQDDGK